jgi:hypothetical protein
LTLRHTLGSEKILTALAREEYLYLVAGATTNALEHSLYIF